MRISILLCICIGLLIGIAAADTLKLKDGTTVQGKVISQGEKYWVKLADGTTRTIPKSEVESLTKGDVAPAAPVAPAVPGGAPKGPAPAPAIPGGAAFSTVKYKAESVDSPVLAVQIWQNFIDSKPAANDLEAAKTELAKWQQLEKGHAEKVNGKWIGGAEHKELMKKVHQLIEEGYASLNGERTLDGAKKLEEALKIYPSSFEANYGLGYIYLVKGAIGANGRGNIAYQDKAVKSLETATKLKPTSAGAWSNLSIIYNIRGRYAEAVEAAYKGVKIEDSKQTVQNLVNCIAFAPRGMQTNNEKVKPIMEDAVVLASKHGISPQGGGWTYIPPELPSEAAAAAAAADPTEGKPGPAWRGTGFIIAADGYIMTNHHVATGAADKPASKNISFLVRFDDGSQKSAELVALDEHADIALLKLSDASKLPFLKIASDNPKQAAQALVLGYPATGLEEVSMQVSSGDVASINIGEEHEVWFHLSTTHGNSGGPIVDKNCRLIAILTGGRTVYNVTYVLGVGPNQIKKFLASLGDKAPKVEYADAGTGEFNGESLTDQARKATVLITAIRGGEKAAATKPSDLLPGVK